MAAEKIRFRFAKTGNLRFLSHHDLMRSGERMLRRARIPFKMTGGFHPTPRFVFALSLPLGVIGLNEVLELELTEPRCPEETRTQLNAQAPAGLTLLTATGIDLKRNAVPRRALYRLPIPSDHQSRLNDKVSELLAQTQVWAERTRPRPRRVDIRSFLRKIFLEDGALQLDLWVTQFGTARSEELIALLGLQPVLETGAILERIDLEIHDEITAAEGDGPPTEPPQNLPLDIPPDALSEVDEMTTQVTWGLSPTGPVVE